MTQIIEACDLTKADDKIDRANTIIMHNLQLAMSKISGYPNKRVDMLVWETLLTRQLCYAVSVQIAFLLRQGAARATILELTNKIAEDVKHFEEMAK